MKTYYKSVIGASHMKNGLPCQDSSLSEELIYKSGLFKKNTACFAVVCDGHGSERHFRSETGSKIAVDVAKEAALKFLTELARIKTELKRKKIVFSIDNYKEYLSQLAKSVVTRWGEEVKKDYIKKPFTEERFLSLSEKDRNKVLNNIEIAYGSTVLFVIMTKDSCSGFQLGDGDIVVIEGENAFSPVETDDRLIGGVTTSLCDRAAVNNCRFFYIGHKVKGVIVTCDGIRNSFNSDEAYLSNMLKVFKEFTKAKGKIFDAEVTELLQYLTENGSGDDVSIAIMSNI